MATRRGPGDPVDPFASLPLGQTLSGERERERDAARRALDASLGRNLSPDSLLGRVLADDPPVMSEQAIRTAETIAALRETPDEAARSADLADVQRQLAARAEQARQQSLQNAERNRTERAERAARELAEARARQEEIRLRALRARQAEQAREDHARVRAQNRQAEQDDALVDSQDGRTLRIIEQRLQRKVEAVQRALTALTEDLADVQQMLAKKAPAPTGNEEAPFREGERHLDLGGTE